MAREHGVFRTAKVLSLEYGKLKYDDTGMRILRLAREPADSRTGIFTSGIVSLGPGCMAHGRRQFMEVAENFPEECRYVLETLGGIWHHDALAREHKLSPEERACFSIRRTAVR